MSGEVVSHFPPETAVCGSAAVAFFTSKKRNSSSLACGKTSAALLAPESENPMFDCPDASHTSPTTTSETVTVSEPRAVNTPGVACTASGSSVTLHRPAASASAVLLCPANSTVTFSPASAVPQTGTGCPACNTICSQNSPFSFTAARPCPLQKTKKDRIPSPRFFNQKSDLRCFMR